MAIQFRLIRNEIRSNKHYGKYLAHTVKGSEVTLREIEQQIQANCSAKASDVRAVLAELYDTIRHMLQDGHVVNLGELGKFHISVKSTPVEDPKEFRVDRHVTGFKCNYSPYAKRYPRHKGRLAGHIHHELTDGCKAVKKR
jgi:predicted histone-like DNA-binding protein